MSENQFDPVTGKTKLSDKTVEMLKNGFVKSLELIAPIEVIKLRWKNRGDFFLLKEEAKQRIVNGTPEKDDVVIATTTLQDFNQDCNKLDIVAKFLKSRKENINEINFDEVEKQNPDFLPNIWNAAQNYSSEEMQDLWAKMLSAEIDNPNSFSVATIEKLKTMTPSQVNAFNTLIQSTCAYESKNIIFADGLGVITEIMLGITKDELNELEALSLIKIENVKTMLRHRNEENELTTAEEMIENQKFNILSYDGFIKEGNDLIFKQYSIYLTDIAFEIAKLVKLDFVKVNKNYVLFIKDNCKGKKVIPRVDKNADLIKIIIIEIEEYIEYIKKAIIDENNSDAKEQLINQQKELEKSRDSWKKDIEVNDE